jgi:hypothetical protein
MLRVQYLALLQGKVRPAALDSIRNRQSLMQEPLFKPYFPQICRNVKIDHACWVWLMLSRNFYLNKI